MEDKKPNLLKRLYNWTISWAEKPQGLWALAILSFAESSFFPIPPDVLLIPLVFGAPKKWWKIAAACTAASVLGGVFGLFGVTAGLLLLLIKLAGLESLGRSYLAPFGEAEVKGALVRERLAEQKWRDGTLRPLDERNQR